jgi:hypothetical protein
LRASARRSLAGRVDAASERFEGQYVHEFRDGDNDAAENQERRGEVRELAKKFKGARHGFFHLFGAFDKITRKCFS